LEMSLIPSNYQDSSLPFKAMTGIWVLIYLCGMYALLYRQCRSWSVAVFVAVLSLAIIQTIEPTYWGLGSLKSITPASLFVALTPLIALAFLQNYRRWQVILVFGFVGLMGNIHLISTMNLAIILLLVYLGLHRFKPSSWPTAAGCIFASLVGAFPYLSYFIVIRFSEVPPDAQINTAAVLQAIQFGDLAVLYPEISKELLDWFLISCILLIPALAALSKVERFRVRDIGAWIWFLCGGLVVALGLQAASQYYGRYYNRSAPVIDFFRASKFVMLPIYVLFAQALTNLFRLVRKNRPVIQCACAALMAAWLVSSDNLRVARYAVLETTTMFMEETEKPRRIQRHHDRKERKTELANIAQWAKDKTAIDSVFISQDIEFRLLSSRSITGSFDDTWYIYYLTPWHLQQWNQRMTQQNQLLHPPTGRIKSDDLKNFADELAKKDNFKKATQWYAIVNTDLAPKLNGEIEEVSSGNWGKHYRVFQVR